MNGINTILIILIYTSFIDLAQKVYVTLGTTSNMYFKTDDCKKLKSAGCSSFSISIQQAKSIGTKSCDICYSANDIQYYQPTISSSKNTSKKTDNQTSFSASSIEIPSTSSRAQLQMTLHVGYTTFYNSCWLIPNWLAQWITSEEVRGTFPHSQNLFEPDSQVKGQTPVSRDYSNSGYSRRHLAPTAEMKWSKQAMLKSFYSFNICLQVAEFKSGFWECLKRYCRVFAGESDLYICSDPIDSVTPKRIGDNKEAVPTGFYKVLSMNRTGRWQAIGFMFPNNICKGFMFDYSYSVDEIEKLWAQLFL